MKLHETPTGIIEIEIIDNCSYDQFVSIAKRVKKQLGIEFVSKIGDLESYYWDFEFDKLLFTIHHNVFVGVSIYLPESKLSPTETHKILNKVLNILQNNSL